MGGRVPHVTLKGPSLLKEIAVATVMGFVAGFAWKQFHWNEQKKSRTFHDLLEKGEVTVVSEE